MLSRNKLYLLIFVACITGYVWLYYSLGNGYVANNSTSVCIFKHVTKVPCPSCGATRSVLAIYSGDFKSGFLINPMGYLLISLMILLPVWISFDFIRKRNSLYNAYMRAEHYLRLPRFAVPLIMLLVLNWIWNISKGL